jgi:phosphoribosyl 1,2-cyclic phosphodiesterase
MHLSVTALASGSNGNCYYIGNETEAVLVDAGISCREVVKRMTRLGLSMDLVKGIFITHEHSDHIFGLNGLAKKFRVPLYGTAATLRRCGVSPPDALARPIRIAEDICIGGLVVSSFSKFHDAVEPCCFIVSGNDVRVGVFTDIGKPCAGVVQQFATCHAVFLETNYDDDLLERGNYPYHLKNRIRGDFGHLSNKQALQLFREHRSEYLSHLFLSHLSKNNNCPVLVQDLFKLHAGSTNIILASRFEETAVYHVTGSASCPPAVNNHRVQVAQLEFSFS